MLIDSFSEDVVWLRRTVAQDYDGMRVFGEKEMGRLRGAFIKNQISLQESAGSVIPVSRCSFTTFSRENILPGDILLRQDGAMLRVLTKKSSPPKIKGSIISINQYETEELDYDGRSGNL